MPESSAVEEEEVKDGTNPGDGKVHLMPEHLVVCGWRCIKEVSLLLGQLTFTVPVLDTRDTELSLLNVLQVLKILKILELLKQ